MAVNGYIALSSNVEAFANNRRFQTVEPEKLTRKFDKNDSCALLGAGAYIWSNKFEIIRGKTIYFFKDFFYGSIFEMFIKNFKTLS